MGNSDEAVAVLHTEEQRPSCMPDSLDFAVTGLRGALSRMNMYGDKVLRLHSQLEESEKTVKSLRHWKQEYRRERLQQPLDGPAAAPPHRAAPWNQTARLEDRLESRLLRLERLLSQRLQPRRVADAGVQAGEAGRPKASCCCRRRGAWWPEAAAALWSACLVASGLLLARWAGGAASVVINIGQQSL